MKKIIVIGGGTVSHVRNHLALCAPAYGNTARSLNRLFAYELDFLASDPFFNDFQVDLHLTKMADRSSDLETSEDVERLIDNLVADSETRCIVMNAAMVDFFGYIGDEPPGKHSKRLKTKDGAAKMNLTPAPKVIEKIRKHRKDIFLVAFKTTTGATPEQQYSAGLELMKRASVNLVMCNDTVTRRNFIIAPEEARYTSQDGYFEGEAMDRDLVLRTLARMTLARIKNSTFTRSIVKDGQLVDWNSPRIHESLRTVVNHCIDRGAYKPFNGATVGHFAFKDAEGRILTSIRKSNFNLLHETGLVEIEPVGDYDVIAYGAKPSVGGQSQRQIFKDHPGYDCIVHFHCPIKPGSKVPQRPQWQNECGSHECGKNTSEGLEEIEPGIKAVYLQHHGPNVVFKSGVNPQDVIRVIEDNFDLSLKTGGMFG